MNGDDAAVDPTVRRSERRWTAAFAVVGGAGLVLTVVCVAALVSARDAGAAASPLYTAGVPFGMLLAVGALTVGVLRRDRQRPRVVVAGSPLFELPTHREREDLLRALRRGDPIPPHQRDLGRRVARHLAGRRNLGRVYLLMAPVFALNAVIQSSSIVWWVWVVVAVGCVPLGASQLWLAGRMRAAETRLSD